MKCINKQTIKLCYQSYIDEAPYNFDQTQIKSMFEKIGMEDFNEKKFIPKSFLKCYHEHSKEYSDLFCLFFLLYHIKFYTEKLDKSIYLQDFENAKTAFKKVFSTFILTATIFTELEVLLQANFDTDVKFFSFDYIRFFDNLRKSICVYEKKKDSKKFKYLIRSDIRLLEDRINTYKFLLPFFTIIISPFYTQKYKDSALNVFKVLKIILNKSTLQYIQIQEKKVDFQKEAEYRGHKDGTTRILGIFTRYNDDVFLFRLDFPHIKETDIHVNLHEKRGKNLVEAFFPMTKEEIDKYKIPADLLNDITLYQEGLYWFKRDTKKIIAETSMPQDLKDSINGLYKKQSHYEFATGNKEKCYDKLLKYYIDIFLNLNVSDDAFVEEFDREDSKNVEIIQNILISKVCSDCLIIHTLLEMGKDDASIKDILGLDDERYTYYKDEIIPKIEEFE